MASRKVFVAIVLALLCESQSHIAARAGDTPVVGILVSHVPATDPVFDLFRQSFQELGYHDGRNIVLKIVSAEGHLERLPTLTQGLLSQGVDVIISTNEVSARAAKAATSQIPIVMVGWGFDPVRAGLIDNLRRPSGNITGTYSTTSDLESKRLEILKLALPDVSRVAVFRHQAFGESALSDLRRSAQMLRIRLEAIELKSGDELQSAFESARRVKAGAVLLVWSPVFYLYREKIAALALEYRMPVVSSYATEMGAFISYGIDIQENARRASYYVDRILKGTNPSQLPVEELSKLRLVVDLRTARKLGINIPESILARADEVIQ